MEGEGKKYTNNKILKKNHGLPYSRTRGPAAPIVLVMHILHVNIKQIMVSCHYLYSNGFYNHGVSGQVWTDLTKKGGGGQSIPTWFAHKQEME